VKTVEISDEDYRKLEWLGSDKWMSVKGDKPLPVQRVLRRCIEKEWDTANPPRYQSTVGRGD
jgi:hypothetical protein